MTTSKSFRAILPPLSDEEVRRLRGATQQLNDQARNQKQQRKALQKVIIV